jgi:hypothetical protein
MQTINSVVAVKRYDAGKDGYRRVSPVFDRERRHGTDDQISRDRTKCRRRKGENLNPKEVEPPPNACSCSADGKNESAGKVED